MVRKTSSWIGTILFLTSLTAYAGGPPILTTSEVPEYFIVGRAETFVFVVRGMCAATMGHWIIGTTGSAPLRPVSAKSRFQRFRQRIPENMP